MRFNVQGVTTPPHRHEFPGFVYERRDAMARRTRRIHRYTCAICKLQVDVVPWSRPGGRFQSFNPLKGLKNWLAIVPTKAALAIHGVTSRRASKQPTLNLH